MSNASRRPEPSLRAGRASDTEECVALWVTSCADRDGVAVPGVAERARPKFEHAVAWVVAEREDAEVAGFVLATEPGSGGPSDPPGAVVVGLVAVRPSDQGAGLATRMLAAVESRLVAAGFDDAVLHVLSDNAAAVRLYESAGWTPFGAAFEHPLLKRPTQTYRRSLALAAGR